MVFLSAALPYHLNAPATGKFASGLAWHWVLRSTPSTWCHPDRPIRQVNISAAIATFGGLAGGEVILIIAVILILFLPRHVDRFGRGFRDGLSAFRKACDEQAHAAGRSLGGIHGNPAAQALSPDNEVAELYNPAVFNRKERQRSEKKKGWLSIIWRRAVNR